MDRADYGVSNLFRALTIGLSSMTLEWWFVLSPPGNGRKSGSLFVEVACLGASALLCLCCTFAVDLLPELTRRRDRLILERQAVLGKLSLVPNSCVKLAKWRGLAVEGGPSARWVRTGGE
eukprot:scaffold114677_cov38-Prasinocladus_malaysianus.AAC.4